MFHAEDAMCTHHVAAYECTKLHYRRCRCLESYLDPPPPTRYPHGEVQSVEEGWPTLDEHMALMAPTKF